MEQYVSYNWKHTIKTYSHTQTHTQTWENHLPIIDYALSNAKLLIEEMQYGSIKTINR